MQEKTVQEKTVQEKTGQDDPHGFRWSFLHPQYFGTWLCLVLIAVLTFLPRRLSLKVGAAVGSLFYRLNAKRRAVATTNLSLCFPELSEDKRDDLVKTHFKKYGQAAIDTGLVWWASEKRLKQLVEFEGKDEFERLLSRGEKVIVFVPHALGMDVMGVTISGMYKAATMMKVFANPIINWLMVKGRRRYPETLIITRDDGIRRVVRTLNDGYLCYYAADEDLGAENSVFAPFFGVQRAMLPALGKLARVTKAKVVTVFCEIDRKGKYLVKLKPVLENFPSGNEQTDVQVMCSAIESGVREAPEYYMWTFKIFKTRPGNETIPYA